METRCGKKQQRQQNAFCFKFNICLLYFDSFGKPFRWTAWLDDFHSGKLTRPTGQAIALHRILDTVLNRNRQVYFLLRLTAHFTPIQTFSATADCLLIHLTMTAFKYWQKPSMQQLPLKKWIMQIWLSLIRLPSDLPQTCWYNGKYCCLWTVWPQSLVFALAFLSQYLVIYNSFYLSFLTYICL